MIVYFVCYSVSVSQSTLVRLESSWVMAAGNCTAWSMVSSQMDRCRATRHWEEAMTRLTHSSLRLGLGNMFLELYLWIWNQLLWVCIIIYYIY